jgi:hypothetical protein
VGTWADGTYLFYVSGTAGGDAIFVAMTGTDELIMAHKVNGAYNVNVSTTAANLTTGVWYGVVARWDTVANVFRVEVYDALGALIQGVENTAQNLAMQADTTTIQIGTIDAGAVCSFDNIFIANDYDEPLEDFLTITSYTAYGAAATSILPLVGREMQNIVDIRS